MEVLAYLVPLALALGLLGLSAFLWSLKTGQYEDLEGAAWRAIMDDGALPVATVDGPVDRPIERGGSSESAVAEH
jgi:cbb3-type cytochrome oxidase maturation protein